MESEYGVAVIGEKFMTGETLIKKSEEEAKTHGFKRNDSIRDGIVFYAVKLGFDVMSEFDWAMLTPKKAAPQPETQ